MKVIGECTPPSSLCSAVALFIKISSETTGSWHDGFEFSFLIILRHVFSMQKAPSEPHKLLLIRPLYTVFFMVVQRQSCKWNIAQGIGVYFVSVCGAVGFQALFKMMPYFLLRPIFPPLSWQIFSGNKLNQLERAIRYIPAMGQRSASFVCTQVRPKQLYKWPLNTLPYLLH